MVCDDFFAKIRVHSRRPSSFRKKSRLPSLFDCKRARALRGDANFSAVSTIYPEYNYSGIRISSGHILISINFVYVCKPTDFM